MVLEKSKVSRFISGTVREITANLVAVNLYPLGIFEKSLKAQKHSRVAVNPRPILLVHGVMHNRSAFVSLKSKMERMGWQNVHTINYRTFHGNILQMVESLNKKVKSIMESTGAPQIDIVAHSLGGIVSRTYMSLGEGRGKIKKLVTLGTPHQGTHMSFVAKGLSRGALDADLRVNSYLIRLLTGTALPKNSELISIYSPFDWTVVPGEHGAARGEPETAIKNIRLEYVGHAGLLYSSEAYEAVVENLLAGDPEPL